MGKAVSAVRPGTLRRRYHAPAASVAILDRLRDYATWREGFDPVRGLTMGRLRGLLAGTTRGEYAELMWLIAAPNIGVESLDADLYSLIERRTAALSQMEWKIATVAETTEGYDRALAEEQAAALRRTYERIDNLYALITHLEMASFRGYAAAEKLYDEAGELCGFSLVNPWNLCRVGFEGEWCWNPAGDNISGRSLPEDHRLDAGAWVLHTVPRPLAPLALRKFVSGSLGERDWDAFVEIYGVPGGVVVGPPNVPADKESEYQSAAEDIAKGGSGYLPNGADYKANDGPRGTSPFKERLEWLQKQLILAGTGGQCSMLEGASGLGKGGQTQSHEEVFTQLARRDARAIGERLNRAVDREVLDERFPGRPRLAYWTLSLNEEPSTDAAVERIGKLSTAGYRVDPAEVGEITGHKVTVIAAPAGPAETWKQGNAETLKPAEVANREAAPALSKPTAAFLEAAAAQIAPVTDLLDKLPDEATDPEGYRSALAELRERLPELMDPAVLADALGDDMLAATEEVANAFNPLQPRGNPGNKGRWFSAGTPSGTPLKFDPWRAKPATLHPQIAAHLGIKDATVHVDAEHLASKHPELFKTPEEARAYAAHVLAHATHVVPGTNPHTPTAQLIHKFSRKTAVIGVEKIGGVYRVNSAHTLGHHQVGDRIAEALASGEGFEVKNRESGIVGEGAKGSSDLGGITGEGEAAHSRSLTGPRDPVPTIISTLCGDPV